MASVNLGPRFSKYSVWIVIFSMMASSVVLGYNTNIFASYKLHTGQTLQSPSGDYTVTMQDDCNLCMYNPAAGTQAMFASNTNNQGSGCYAIMQTFGDLEVRDRSDNLLFSSHSSDPNCKGMYNAMLEDSGHFTIYCEADEYADFTTYPVWSKP